MIKTEFCLEVTAVPSGSAYVPDSLEPEIRATAECASFSDMMKILIVDDSTLERKLLSSLIKKNGITNDVLQAENGEVALQVLASNFQDICLIVLDWQMPVMSGIEFMQGVVKVPQVAQIPIVMVTASSSEENKKQAQDVNPNLAAYVIKPYKPEDILNAIRPHLK